MMARLSAFFLLLSLGVALPASAQDIPFDMTPERPADEEDAAEETQPEVEEGAPEATADADPPRRYLLPASTVLLQGENAERNWAVYLTEAQAASGVRVALGYQNAVVVAPESSRLRLLVNGTAVIDTPVEAAEGIERLSADVPAGLLRPGRNEIGLAAQQRHRTDCTIASTYELWSEIDSVSTFLDFGDADAGFLVDMDDLRAVGPAPDGRGLIEIVAPALTRSDISADILRLAQGVALFTVLPDPKLKVVTAPEEASADAALRILLGSAEEIGAAGIGQGPTVRFAEPEPGAPPTLLVTGADRAEWLAAIEEIVAQVDRPAQMSREALITEAWHAPNAPMIYGGREIAFSEFGLSSRQVSGRRFVQTFNFAVPADFYAGSYGQARILLDAAYSDAVRPGSLINIYVNENIATSVPITTRRGAVLERHPIPVTMRHFRPGLNTLTLEVDLLTQADEVCAPGATAGTDPRFALFATSRFVVPDFARVAQRPNLSAVAGVGYPYLLSAGRVPVVLPRENAHSLSAAANLLARVATAGGRVVPVEVTASVAAATGRDAIFVGAAPELPPDVLQWMNLDISGGWAAPDVSNVAGARTPGVLEMEEWRGQLEGNRFQRSLNTIGNWMSETFDITTEMLRFAPRQEAAFRPGRDDTIVMVQAADPQGEATWTLATAAEGETLSAGMALLTSNGNWPHVDGRLSTLKADGATVVTQAGPIRLVATQPPGVANYRLIAANWLSSNILSYSVVLVTACLVLGVATSALLARLGRRRR